jgi:tetratricopeptide (TPR) repeat protein
VQYREAQRIQLAALGSDHPGPLLATTLVGMGSVYLEQDRLEEALKHFEAALPIFVRALGASHSEVVGCVCSIGSVYEEQGRLEEALAQYRFRQCCRLSLYFLMSGARSSRP